MIALALLSKPPGWSDNAAKCRCSEWSSNWNCDWFNGRFNVISFGLISSCFLLTIILSIIYVSFGWLLNHWALLACLSEVLSVAMVSPTITVYKIRSGSNLSLANSHSPLVFDGFVAVLDFVLGAASSSPHNL